MKLVLLIVAYTASLGVYALATAKGVFELQVASLLLPLGLGYLLLCSIRPSIGLGLAIASVPLQRGFLGQWGFMVTVALVSLGLGGTLLGDREWLKRLRAGYSLPIVLAILLAAYLLFSLYLLNAVPTSGQWFVLPWETGEGSPHLAMTGHTLIFFILLAISVTSRKLLEAALTAIVVIWAIILGTSLYQWISQLVGAVSLIDLLAYSIHGISMDYADLPTVERGLGGIFLGWVSSAQLGNTVTTLAFIAVPFLWYRAERFRGFLAMLLALSLFIVYATLTLVNWLAMLAAGAVFLLFSSRSKALAIYLFVVLVIILVPIALAYGSSMPRLPGDIDLKIQALLNMPGGGTTQHFSIYIRDQLNRANMRMFSENPLFGTGYGTVVRFMDPHVWTSADISRLETLQRYPHNSYMQILGQLGSVGILLFGAIVVIAGYSLFELLRHSTEPLERALSIGLMAALVANLVFFLGYADWSFSTNFWLVIALTVGLRHVHRASADK